MTTENTFKLEDNVETAAGAGCSPRSCSPSFIYSGQGELWGEKQVIGFGSDQFRVEEIPKKQANAVIIANHYSKKTATDAHTRLCYAVMMGGEMVGVLQFGYAMNPASCGSIVEGAGLNDYLELNRMWLDDKAPKNSESRAISYCIKAIRRRMPTVEWIMSFADERCGRLGVTYQAANFEYFGEHTAKWYVMDGEWIHEVNLNNGKRKKKQELLDRGILERAEVHHLRQFRYIYFIQKRARRKCLLKRGEYPKHASEGSMESRAVSNDEGQGQILHDAPFSSENSQAQSPEG